jgi:predicted membrane protein (TIGR00267 family)
MADVSADSVMHTIWNSLNNSIGEVIFGMEDGVVSIFGLVFGVAASSNNSATVLLAGATGAAAASVSMMAGAYLDVTSKKAKAQAAIAHEKQEIQNDRKSEEQEIRGRLKAAGFNEQETKNILQALETTPHTMIKFEKAFELHIGKEAQENPIAHAFWMFIADAIASFTPVLPFAFLALAPARIVSLILAAILLILLGMGRGLVSHRNLLLTTVETVGIATAAALAGVFIGKLLG